jgi:hypothetical protein
MLILPPPAKAIVDFRNQLAARGIDLVVADIAARRKVASNR